MALGWIAPAALLGIALIALPIAVHLLVRQHARTLAFPSLRFLRETQLAALRRRTIQDALLLLCRVAIVTTAATALAGPVLQTAARTAGYAGRTSRAIVPLDGADDERVRRIADGAFASASFRRAELADALADALRWLDRQPPSSREIVIAGALRRGSVSDADLSAIPAAIGVRFEAVGGNAATEVTWPVLARRNGSLVRIDRAVHFEAGATRVTEGTVTDIPDDLITIVARSQDLTLAQAALRAALEGGVPWPDVTRRSVIVWAGADEAAILRDHPPPQVIRMTVPAPPSAAADAVRSALNRVSPDPARFEPVMLTAEQLSAWSRRPGPPAANAPLSDEGDRRWVWGVVLLLLAIETWLRRSKGDAPVAVADDVEARVA